MAVMNYGYNGAISSLTASDDTESFLSGLLTHKSFPFTVIMSVTVDN